MAEIVETREVVVGNCVIVFEHKIERYDYPKLHGYTETPRCIPTPKWR